jgi:hypothetical protein
MTAYSIYLWRFGITAAALGKAARNFAACARPPAKNFFQL